MDAKMKSLIPILSSKRRLMTVETRMLAVIARITLIVQANFM